MAAANTYTPLFTTTLSSAQSAITFSSIPSTYTDLVLVASVTGSGTGDVSTYVNGDSSSGFYSRTVLDGSGATAASARSSSANFIYLNYNGATTSANPNTYIVNFQNYANTTTYKSLLARQSNAANGVAATVGLWRNTAAITSITLQISSVNFAIGSTFTLYGILAA